MQVFLQAMVATAFIAGGTGMILWLGHHDGDTSWYPWPSLRIARGLLSIAAVAAALAFVAGVFTVTT